MRRPFLSLLALLLPAVAIAEDGRRIEVAAALAVARADLRAQVLAVPVAANVTVKSLAHSGAGINIDGLLSSAQQVGQPRWLGEDIVQVALRLSADALVDQVRAAGLAAGMRKMDVERFARQWAGRSLQGSGQAIPAARVSAVVSALRPAAWVAVPDSARIDASARARQAASGAIVDQTAAIPLGPKETAADDFTSPDSRDRIAAWADTMPATRVVLSDQREVELSVYLDKQGLGDVLRSQLSSAVTSQPDKWQAIDARIMALPISVVGRASVVLPAAPAPRAAIVLHETPAWAADTLTAEGTAATGGSALHAARRAEAAARAAMRQKILKLPLADRQTIELAVTKDLAAANAVAIAIDRARVYQTDYNPDGSAIVRISLDGNELLDVLTTPR